MSKTSSLRLPRSASFVADKKAVKTSRTTAASGDALNEIEIKMDRNGVGEALEVVWSGKAWSG